MLSPAPFSLASTAVLAHLAAFAALLPAAAAPAALAPAPTDVTVAWVSDAHQAVAVTWQETGDLADRVILDALDGTAIGDAGHGNVPAGQPNRIEFSIAGLPLNKDLRFSVQTVDSTGQPLSEYGRSPDFDTDQPPPPVLTEALPRPDGTIALAWKPGAYHDDTPGDPLDLPAAPPRFRPAADSSTVTFEQWENLTPAPIAATSIVVPARKLPEFLAVQVTPNEFGSPPFPAAIARIARTDLSASVPAATTGRPLRVTGVAKATRLVCDPGICFTETTTDPARTLHLQARTSPNASWQTVATTTTAAKTGGYSFQITSPGSRDYRVVADPVGWHPNAVAKSYAATAAITATSSGGGGGLPITGAPAAWIAAAGALLVALGAGLIMTGRRRRRTA